MGEQLIFTHGFIDFTLWLMALTMFVMLARPCLRDTFMGHVS